MGSARCGASRRGLERGRLGPRRRVRSRSDRGEGGPAAMRPPPCCPLWRGGRLHRVASRALESPSHWGARPTRNEAFAVGSWADTWVGQTRGSAPTRASFALVGVHPCVRPFRGRKADARHELAPCRSCPVRQMKDLAPWRPGFCLFCLLVCWCSRFWCGSVMVPIRCQRCCATPKK